MRACQTESDYYPRQPLVLSEIRSVLCVAPHPDDEVLGCGGLLSLLAAAGCSVHILILSAGERALGDESSELGSDRIQESARASAVQLIPSERFLTNHARGSEY